MDTHKKIAKALVNKSFAEAKEMIFKSLYAKASLALDEARFAVANAVFNTVEEEAELDEMAQTPERARQMKAKIADSKRVAKEWDKAEKASWKGDRMDYGEYVDGAREARGDTERLKRRDAMEKKSPKLYGKSGRIVKKSVKEATEQLDEVSPPDMEKMTGSKKTKASFAKQYGKRGKSVMYATAWKLHNKKAGKD
jgi:hypothetical protein